MRMKHDIQKRKNNCSRIAWEEYNTCLLYGHYINVSKKPETWQEIQRAVRNGTIRRYFNIGDQLTCSHSEFGTLVWDIIGF